jgi:hypothetical protein
MIFVIYFMVIVHGRQVYISFAVVRAAISAVHQSRVVSRRETVGVRRGGFLAVHPYVG